MIVFYSVAHWLTFRYRIENGELYVQKGVFIKKKRYIQQQRVQSIDITAGIFQRMFGLVKVKVETAGGGAEPEMSLIAVTRSEAEQIRAKLKRKQDDASAAVESEDTSMTGSLSWKKNQRLRGS